VAEVDEMYRMIFTSYTHKRKSNFNCPTTGKSLFADCYLVLLLEDLVFWALFILFKDLIFNK